MPNRYGKASLASLKGVHPDLVKLMTAILEHWDHSVVDGERTKAEQIKNLARGVSQTINSKHLKQESGYAEAVDTRPYPFDGYGPIEKVISYAKQVDPGLQTFEFYGFLGFVQGFAAAVGIDVRLGADWDSDRDFADHSFIDLGHIELVHKP